MGSAGYPVSRRTVLAGPAAWGVAAWAGRLTGEPVTRAGAAGRGVDVRVSRDGFSMHAEPCVAASPRDPRNLLAACMVWQAGKRGLATYVSRDAGATWHGNGLLPGVRPAYDGDVSVAFDGSGTGYVCGWVGSRAAEQPGRACVWRTSDGGRRFTEPVTVTTGLIDHPWLAADRQASCRPGTVYVAGDYFGHGGLVFTRSTDGGRSFEPLRFPDPASGSQGGRAPMVASGPGGLAAIAYYVERPDASQRIGVITSTDYGQTLTAPVFVTDVTPPPIVAGVNTTTGGPAIAATPGRQDLHLAVATVDTTAPASRLLLFSSSDRGATWSAPRTVARSTSTVYFQPQLAVGAGGRIALSAFALPIHTGSISVILFVPSLTAPGSARQQPSPPGRSTPAPAPGKAGSATTRASPAPPPPSTPSGTTPAPAACRSSPPPSNRDNRPPRQTPNRRFWTATVSRPSRPADEFAFRVPSGFVEPGPLGPGAGYEAKPVLC
jgi:hypothetical protein